MEGPAAKTADRPVAARAGKTPWLVTVLKAYDGRSAIEATVEPSGRDRRNQGVEFPDERRLTGRRASIGLLDGAARGTPYTYRRKKRKKERRMGPVQQWCRCGSA
jgi:hypothetical protein